MDPTLNLAFILVGDHLGQIKRVYPNGDVSIIGYTDLPSKDNPVVSIEPVKLNSVKYYDNIHRDFTRFLIGKRNSHIYHYNCIDDELTLVCCNFIEGEQLISALPIQDNKILLVYEKRIDLVDYNHAMSGKVVDHFCPNTTEDDGDNNEPPKKRRKKKKTSQDIVEQTKLDERKDLDRPHITHGYFEFKKPIKLKINCASISGNNLAVAGSNLPLKVFDIKSKRLLFEGDQPEPDWLGIRPEIYVSSLQFVGGCAKDEKLPDKVVTCSKSDSVIRVFDINSNNSKKPCITVDMNQTAFNEYASAPRFTSVSSSPALTTASQSIVVGSNVGGLFGIELRFNIKRDHRKKLQKRNYSHIGGFKGSRGSTIKDVKVTFQDGGQKLISCCLDRFLRIHDFTTSKLAIRSRYLHKEINLSTKPTVCFPVHTKTES